MALFFCCGVRKLIQEHLFKSSGFIKTFCHGQTFSSFSALLHLVLKSPTNWERHGWYIRPVSGRALCTPPCDCSTPDKTKHRHIGYEHVNINKPASGPTPFTLTWSGALLRSRSQMFILCFLFHKHSVLPWWNSARLVDGKSESTASHPGMWMVITHKAALKLCQALQVVFSLLSPFFPCESFSNRASAFPAVVMGRGSEQALSQHKGTGLRAKINTL